MGFYGVFPIIFCGEKGEREVKERVLGRGAGGAAEREEIFSSVPYFFLNLPESAGCSSQRNRMGS